MVGQKEFYRVRHWKQFYEKNHKETEVVFRWISIPTKHDGKGFRQLARHRRRVEIFCAFILILQVAAKMNPRGDLIDEDGPLTADDLQEETGYPAKIFDLAFSVLSDDSKKYYWLELVKSPNLVRTSPEQVLLQNRQNKTDSTDKTDINTTAPGKPAALPPGFIQFWTLYPPRGRERGSRPKALAIWKKKHLEPVATRVNDSLAEWLRSEIWTKESGQFICGADRWLREERYMQNPVPAEASATAFGEPVDATDAQLQSLGFSNDTEAK